MTGKKLLIDLSLPDDPVSNSGNDSVAKENTQLFDLLISSSGKILC